MNIMRNGGYGMRYEVIRRFAAHNDDEVIRLNAYVAIDEERAVSDPAYKNTLNFILTLRDLGFKVIEKPIRWYSDEYGRTYGKANLDMEMGLDIIAQSDRLDVIYLFTGDGDLVSVVTMVQNKGCRVELISFANVTSRLKREVDLFIPGYLIPGLLPTAPPGAGAPGWGEAGSRVRGICTKYFLDRSYGFLRFMQCFGKLWVTDTRLEESPYISVFFLQKDLPNGLPPDNLPSRDYILEFTLNEGENGFVASDIELVLTNTLTSKSLKVADAEQAASDEENAHETVSTPAAYDYRDFLRLKVGQYYDFSRNVYNQPARDVHPALTPRC